MSDPWWRLKCWERVTHCIFDAGPQSTMAQTHAVGKRIDPEILDLEVFSHVECCQSVIHTLSEVEVSLVFCIRDYFEFVLRAVFLSIDVDSSLQCH